MCWSFPLSPIFTNWIHSSSVLNSSKICTILKSHSHFCQVQRSFRMEISSLPLVLHLPSFPRGITGFLEFSSFLSLQGSSQERLPALSHLNISLALQMTIPSLFDTELTSAFQLYYTACRCTAFRKHIISGLLPCPIQTVVWSSSGWGRTFQHSLEMHQIICFFPNCRFCTGWFCAFLNKFFASKCKITMDYSKPYLSGHGRLLRSCSCHNGLCQKGVRVGFS